MTSKLDEPAGRRLGVARDAYRLGVRMARSDSLPARRIAAIVQYDFAVETILKAVLLQNNPATKLDTLRFPQLLDEVGLALWSNKTFPGRGHMDAVRHARNVAQHRASPPSRDDLTDARVHVRDALNSITSAAWGQDFLGDLSLHDVEHPDCAAALVKAVEASDDGDRPAAIAWARQALHEGLDFSANHIIGLDVSDLLDLSSVARLGSHFQEAQRRDRRIRVLGLLGFDVVEYLRFVRQAGGAPPLNVNGSLIRYDTEARFDQSDVEWSLDYVSETLRAVEFAMADLKDLFMDG